MNKNFRGIGPVLMGILAGLALMACSAAAPSNLPCWVRDANCGGQPGYLYYTGKVEPGDGPLGQEHILREGALAVALGNFAYELKTQVKSSTEIIKICAESSDGKSVCMSKMETAIDLATDTYVRMSSYEVADKFYEPGGKYYLRIAVHKDDFHASVGRVMDETAKGYMAR